MGRGRRQAKPMTTATSANNAANAPPAMMPVRHVAAAGKSMVNVPDAPAGISQPCCQPLTVTGSSSRPSRSATWPGLTETGR